MLYSQCHAHARLPGISKVPVVGTPFCFIVSFFEAAIGKDVPSDGRPGGGKGDGSGSSFRAGSIMGVVLSFVGSLMTVYTVEGARVCNKDDRKSTEDEVEGGSQQPQNKKKKKKKGMGGRVLIAYPSGWMLIFNLMGGAWVWELGIVPAFLRRARGIIEERDRDHPVYGQEGEEEGRGGLPLLDYKQIRNIENPHEQIAIPSSILLGFIVPSVSMLLSKPSSATSTSCSQSSALVIVWLFTPLYVSLIRKAIRYVLQRFRKEVSSSIYLEASTKSLILMYGSPMLFSVLSQALFGYSWLRGKDDRKEMTRSTLNFVGVDVIYLGLTVLYWLFVEVGWKVVGVMVLGSAVLGPGAGVCLGWIFSSAVPSHVTRSS